MFKLHPRLQADTHSIGDLSACRALLMNDARYPWVILVPTVDDITELHDLDPDTYQKVSGDIRTVSESLSALYVPCKINVGALGNLVPQLHIHVIARTPEDAAWPGPVWGQGQAIPYDKEALTARLKELQSLL
ncbi:HIT domain-containing protein [Sneathiella chinensis]|uniref:Histidine triad protein n=1 Tax=Sneathiella chinensis TaxID=349750 RepID=A0ABQ5U5A5_9PROT|nr:HIT family protein [Sneathiella chinensis]GLQ06492.1 histidine triad protein [Sneathiella chinensis]